MGGKKIVPLKEMLEAQILDALSEDDKKPDTTKTPSEQGLDSIKTGSGLYQDTIQTPNRQDIDTILTPSGQDSDNIQTGHRHHPDSIQTVYKQYSDSIKTPSEHHIDTIQTGSGQHNGVEMVPKSCIDDVEMVSNRHLLDTIQTPSESHPKNRHHIDRIQTPIRLSKSPLKVYDFLTSLGTEGTFTKPFIEQHAAIPYGTIRGAIRKLQMLGIVDLKYDRFSKCHEYKINAEIKILRDHPDMIQTGSKYHPDTISTPSKQDSDRSPIIEEEQYIYNLLSKRFSILYPNLAKLGLGQKQIREFIDSWRVQKFDIKDIPESLERADWAAVNDKSIKQPADYVYKSLIRGPFRRPQGFVSRAEIEAKESAAEALRIKTLQEQQIETMFKTWLMTATNDEKEKALEGYSGPRKDSMVEAKYFQYFKKEVLDK